VAGHPFKSHEGDERLYIHKLIETRPAFPGIRIAGRQGQSSQVTAVIRAFTFILFQVGIDILATPALVKVAFRLGEMALKES